MATPEIKELLLEAGPFARLSAMEQRTKLVKYFTSWFSPDFKVDTINNIRATQRITSHAKSLAMPVGVVLMAILEEASGLGAAQPVGTRGLLGVEADPADTRSDEGQGQGISLAEEQAEDTPVGDAPGQAIPHESAPEPVPATPPTPSQGRRPTRSKGPPAPI